MEVDLDGDVNLGGRALTPSVRPVANAGLGPGCADAGHELAKGVDGQVHVVVAVKIHLSMSRTKTRSRKKRGPKSQIPDPSIARSQGRVSRS
jgi:hypothetical protein